LSIDEEWVMKHKTILVSFIIGVVIGGFLASLITTYIGIQDRNPEIEQLHHQVTTLQSEKRSLELLVENKDIEISYLEDKLEELESLVESLRNEVNSLRSEVDISDIKVTNSQIKIRGLRYGYGKILDDVIEMGANYVQISVFSLIRKDGSISGFQASDDEILYMISEAHERGLKVYLEIYPTREDGHDVKGIGLEDVDNLLENMVDLTIKWAALAEQYGVELFSPPNELFLYVGCDRAMMWYTDILPKIRSVYSGEVAPRGLKFYDWDPFNKQPLETPLIEFNFTGWDYIANDFYASRVQNLEEFRICLRENIRKSIELKEKYGAKGVFYGEVSHLGGTNITQEKDPIFNYLYLKVFFEENIGKVDGFFFWRWDELSPENKLLLKNYYKFEQPYQDLPIEPIKTSKYIEETDKIPANNTSILFQDNFTDLLKIDIHHDPVHLSNGSLELLNGGAFSPIHRDRMWSDFHIEGRIKILCGLAKISVRITEIYAFEIQIVPASFISMDIVEKKNGGSDWKGTPALQIDFLVEVGVWHEFDFWIVDRWFALYIDDILTCNFYEPNAPLTGGLWIGAQLPWIGSNEAHVFFDDIVIYEIANN